MEIFPEMTMTVAGLDRLTGITDPGQVAGDDERHPDPEVPARARRRTFTAQYKQEILAAYDAASAPWPRPGAGPSWMPCTRRGSLTWPRARYGRSCWMRASTWDLSPRSTGCCAGPGRPASAGGRLSTPPR
jgi:hypothetical protein